MGELGIMCYDYVLDMTFAEFQIRLFAYKRMQLRDWEKVRLIAWTALTGSHQESKKLPKSIDKFMSLDFGGKPKSGVSDSQKERYLQAMKEYLNKVNNG